VVYVGEPGEYDTLVQGNAGHRGEWAAAGSSDQCHRRGFSGGSCRQQVTLQYDNPLLIHNIPCLLNRLIFLPRWLEK
jgi:hypothetical protein